tara:strand:+ start:739 stop:1056 length:318 start_codon:yes stop_codon:yes gene_type:complete
MINELNEVEAKVKAAIEVDSKKGIYRSDRGMFTDQRLFELEMKHIFEGNWVFLAHENQIPEIGDYFTTTIGRQPVLITRGKDGNLNAILNTCSHRGATLCRKKKG